MQNNSETKALPTFAETFNSVFSDPKYDSARDASTTMSIIELDGGVYEIRFDPDDHVSAEEVALRAAYQEALDVHAIKKRDFRVIDAVIGNRALALSARRQRREILAELVLVPNVHCNPLIEQDPTSTRIG